MRLVVDLRSDTVTRPSPAMRAAMARAAVGDDVFGEDPTVNELEALAAELTGQDAALFLPSGSMANLIAQIVHVRRGDLVVVGQDCHIVRHEVGSGAAIAGVQYEVIPGSGMPTAAEIEARLVRPTFHTPGAGLVWVENTHNLAGGRITPLAELRRIVAVCRQAGAPLHLDGARVFNAAAALGAPVREVVEGFDSLSFCLSKGLGCPVGSLLAGSREFRCEAHRLRKMLGGGMRQAGVLAAAGVYALRHNQERLALDHALARRLAEGLAGLPGVEVDRGAVDTNIVMATLAVWEAQDLVARCAAEGVLFLALGRRRVRFVTHLDVTSSGIDGALAVLSRVLASAPPPPAAG